MSSYTALLATRRRFGQLHYGDAYLNDPSWFHEALREATDTVIYLALEQDRWQRATAGEPARMTELSALIVRAVHLANLAANAQRAINGEGESFRAAFFTRWRYGFEHYGEAHLQRDNLAEALEELADVEIACELEPVHAAHRGQPLTPAQHGRLNVIASSARAIAEDICQLRERTHDHAAIAA
jgi:hypothetical protein